MANGIRIRPHLNPEERLMRDAITAVQKLAYAAKQRGRKTNTPVSLVDVYSHGGLSRKVVTDTLQAIERVRKEIGGCVDSALQLGFITEVREYVYQITEKGEKYRTVSGNTFFPLRNLRRTFDSQSRRNARPGYFQKK